MSAILYVSGSNMGISRIAEIDPPGRPFRVRASAGTDVIPGIGGSTRTYRPGATAILQMTASLADRADGVVVLGDVGVRPTPGRRDERWGSMTRR